MKIFYTKVACLVFVLLSSYNFASAQRTAVLQIDYISANVTSGTDCDQVCAVTADNQIDWVFDLDDNGTNIDGECWNMADDDNNIVYGGNYNVYTISESAQCNWPSGNVGWAVQAFDEDCTDGCVLGEMINTVSDLACTVNISSSIPSSTGGTTGYSINTCNFSNVDFDGGWNCSGNVNVRWRWIVSGSFIYNTPSNDNICNAIVLGGTTLNPGESVNNINATNICAGRQGGEPYGEIEQTVWYRFTTPADGLLAVDIHLGEDGAGADNPAIAAYRYSGTPGCSFGSLSQVGDDTPGLGTDANSDFTLDCLWGNTTYFIQVGHNDRTLDDGSPGNFDLDISATGYAAGPDNFCNAGEMVTSGNGLLDPGESFAKNNQSNECASDETNEPETDGNDETVWYKFTTGAIVGNNVNVNINRDADIDPFVAVYVACNGTGACNSTNLSNYGLNQVAFEGFPNPVNIPTNDNPTASFVPFPNTTYYIQVDGYDCCNIVGGPEGRFDVSVSMSSTAPYPYDHFCNAYNLGTLASNGTINSPTLHTFNSSSEELCSLNEPNNDEDDETTWLKFTTSSTPGSEIEIDASANNDGSGGLDCLFGVSFAWIRVYEADGSPVLTCPFPNTTSNWFNAISEADSDGGFLDASKRYLDCPKPNTTYYIQVENQGIGCDVSSFTVQVNDNGAYGANDDLCQAYNLGTLTNQGTIQSGSGGIPSAFTTDCATKQAGEPNVDIGESNDQEGSVWFSFTTAAGGVGVKTDVDVSFVSGQGIAVAENEFLRAHLYYDPGNCNTLNDLVEFDNKEDESYYTPDNFVDGCIDNALGDLDPSTRTFGCLEPNTTYYLQVFVKSTPDIGIFDEQGVFDLVIDNSRPIAADNDDFVDATAIPSLGNSTFPSTRQYPSPTQLINENNLCAGVEGFENSVSSILELDHTVWYRFIAPASGSVQFEVVNTSASNDAEEDIEEQISVYEYTGGAVPTASDFSLLMEYDADDDGPFGEDGEITWSDQVFVTCLEPGNTYYVRIDGAYDNLTGYCPGDAMRGDFDLKLRDYDIWETNDRVCNALGITSFTDNATLTAGELATWRDCGTEVTIEMNYLSNYCADGINEIINPWDDAINQTVWYSFEAPATGMITIEAENVYNCDILNPNKRALIDIRLAVYDLLDGFVCTDMATNGASFDLKGESESGITGINCIGLGETLEIDCLEPGRTYYLVVDGKDRIGNSNGEFGEFEIDMTNTIKNILGFNVRDLYRPALNDDICDAIALGNPTGGGVDTDVNNGTYPSPPRTCNNSENTYCADASGDPSINGFTLWGTDNSVWYTFIAPSTGAVEIVVDGDVHGNSDQLSPQIAVFETSNQVTPCAGTLYDIFAGPAISTGFSTTYNSGTINCLEPGNTYFLMVDGGPYAFDLFDLDGTFEVTITEETATIFSPPNDDLCNATSINPFTSFGGGASVSIDDSNRCASREFHIPEPGTFTKDRTVWYTFVTPSNAAGSNGNGTYAIDVNVLSDLPWPFGDAMDPQIAIYESSDNTCSGTITEKYSDYDVFNIPFTESVNIQCLEPATRYWIMVDGSTLNPQGYFNIDVDEDLSPTPISTIDNVCDNANLGVLGSTLGNSLGGTTPLYNNFCTGIEPGEPNPNWLLVNNIDHTVWFSFTTPNVAQNVNVDIELYSDNSDNVDLMMALYLSSDNTCSGTMTEIKSEYDPTILFCLDGLCDETLNDMCLAPNTTYFLQVDGSFLNRQGYFGVEIINDGLVAGPANDAFCNATAMTFNGSGVARLTNQSNECATVELNEPFTDHPIVVSAKRTVWYSFTAPPSGRVTITTEDNDGALTGIDPHWALYQL